MNGKNAFARPDPRRDLSDCRMASEGQAASRPIRRRSVPSPVFAVKELRQANGKRSKNSRLTGQQRQVVTAFPGRAIDWGFVHQRVSFRFLSENRIRPPKAPMCALELRRAKMEFPAADLLHLRHE